jgi:hypothetical protein
LADQIEVLEGHMSLSAAKTQSRPVAGNEPRHRASLFKEDRPRRIDRFISFFGEGESESESQSERSLFGSMASDRWSER